MNAAMASATRADLYLRQTGRGRLTARQRRRHRKKGRRLGDLWRRPVSVAYNPAWGFEQFKMPPRPQPLDLPLLPDRRKPRRVLADPKNQPVNHGEMTKEVAA